MPIPDALTALARLLGDRLARSGPERAQHGQSEAHFAPAPPDAVAYPESTAELAEIMRICASHGCPVVGWGAGTSLEAQALAVAGGLCIDFARMNRVLAVHPDDMDAVVQPGLTREGLNLALRETGLFFPVDPGANASLGGMASTRASGTTTVRFGTMREHVLALEVVLADGRVIRTGSRARKSAAGYDMTGLFVGAEGTLGLITELTLRLRGQPEAIAAGTCAFGSVAEAVACTIDTIQCGLPMARIELVDAETVAAFNAYAGAGLPPVPHLLFELHGTEASTAEASARLSEIAEDHGGGGFSWSSRPEERRALWAMRHNAYYACLARHPGRVALTTDLCVPISQLARAIEETRADIAASPLPGPIMGHVGDGNFHALLMARAGHAGDMQAAQALSGRMAERALRLGGTISGEHGVGLGKRAYMQAEHGEGWQVMGALKAALDPLGILNPGKLVP